MLDVRPDSAGNQFRQRRIELLNALVAKADIRGRKCRILDIGGTFNFWHTWREMVDWTAVDVLCANHDPTHSDEARNDVPVRMIKADARRLDFAGPGEFDIVFSNSVIEHVGIWSDMKAMASEVRRVGVRYLVQTPYYWFPIEPHARTPFVHWLPEPLAYRLVMARRCGFWPKQDTVSGAVSVVQSARLIDGRQMAELFPDAELVRERFMGFTKSLVAVRG